jgi:hypothetical protein
MRAASASKSRPASRRREGAKQIISRSAMRGRMRGSRSSLPWLVAAGLSGAALLGWIGFSNGMLTARR